MNILLDTWATTMWRACWKGGLVVLVVWTICRLLPSMPARFQCWLWRLAILKFVVVLLVPWFFNVPLLPARPAREPIAEITAPVPTLHEPVNDGSALSPPVPTNRTGPMPRAMPTPEPILSAALFLAWMVGLGWHLAGLRAGWRETRRLRQAGSPMEDRLLQEQLANQARAFGVRPPELRSVAGSGSPMLVGIVRPAVLFPSATLGRLSISEQKMVLGHELAHIGRGDLLWSLACSLVRRLFFFHPLAWLSERHLKFLQEVAADELAIARQRHDPFGYGNLLVSVVGKFGPARSLSGMSLETVGSARTLARRLIAMKRIGRVSHRIGVTSGVLLASVLLVGLVPWRLVAAEAKPGSGGPSHAIGAVGAAGDWAESVVRQVEEVVEYATQLQSLDLSGLPLREGQLAHVAGLTRLETLNLTNTGVGDAGLAHLADMTQLQVLDLSATKVTDAGLEHLKGLSRLRVLALADTRVTDAGVKKLQQALPNCKIRTSGNEGSASEVSPHPEVERSARSAVEPLADQAKAIAQIKTLGGKVVIDEKSPERAVIGVDLSGDKVTDAALTAIGAFAGLQSLKLPKVTDAHLASLEGLTTLTTLSFSGPDVTDAGLAHLERFVRLERLDVFQTQVTDAGLEHLRGLARLRVLELVLTEVTGAGLDHLKALPQLRCLRLWGTKVTDAGLTHLRNLPHLGILRLAGTQITDAGLAHFEGLPELRVLELWSLPRGISNVGLGHLQGVPRLESLVLSGTYVTDDRLAGLKGLARLQTLALQDTAVTDAGLAHLEGLTHLRELYLWHSGIADAGLGHLAGLSKLKVLGLVGTKVTDSGLSHLDGLKSLDALDLRNTTVSDEGVKNLQAALPRCKIQR